MTDMTPVRTDTPAAKPKPRPRPQVMRLTEAAAQRIVGTDPGAPIPTSWGLGSGSRTAAAPGNPTRSNMPTMSVPPTRWSRTRGVKILVDPKAVLFLLGTEMDYKADKMQAQFIFNNPNQVSAPAAAASPCN